MEVTEVPGATLSLTALANGNPVTSMQFSKDGNNWDPWEPFAATRTITLAGGNGVNTVYVRFRDGAGNVSQVYSDSITLNMAPTGSIVINDGAESTVLETVTLRLASSGRVSPVTSMQLSKDGVNWYPWESVTTTRSAKLVGVGVNTVYVRFRDSLGNVSQDYSDTIVLVP